MDNNYQQNKASNLTLFFVVLGSAALVLGLLVWIVANGVLAKYNVYAHNTRASDYYDKGNYPAAIVEANAMIRIDPRQADAYYLRGNAYYMTDNFIQAATDYTKAISLEKKKMTLADLYYCRGNCFYSRNKYDPAIADYTQAIRLNPKMTEVYRSRAWMYYEQSKNDAALTDCNTTIRQEPPGSEIYRLRGNIFMAIGRKNKAIEDYKKAITLDPKYQEAYKALAEIYEGDKSYGKAAALYKQAVIMDPSNAYSWGALGWDEYRAGDLDAAIRDSKKAISLNGTLLPPRYNLALCYAVKGDWPRAQEEYRHAMSMGSPDDSNAAFLDIFDALKKQPDSSALKHAEILLAMAAVKRPKQQGK